MEQNYNKETLNRLEGESNKLKRYSEQLQRRIKFLEKRYQYVDINGNIQDKRDKTEKKYEDKQVSRSVHVKKSQNKKTLLLQAKMETAEELRRYLKSQNYNLRRLQEIYRKTKETHHRIKQHYERQAREKVGIFWYKKLEEVSQRRNKKIEETRKAVKAAECYVSIFEERERELVEILNQRADKTKKCYRIA